MRTRETIINVALEKMACDGLFLCELKPEGYLPTDMTTDELHEAVKSLTSGHRYRPYWHDEEVHALLVFLEALRMRHGIVVCECTFPDGPGPDYALIHPSPDRFSRYCKLCEYRHPCMTSRPMLICDDPVKPAVPNKTFREYLQNLLATICRALGLPALATSQKP
jgi:hypothetical protein